MKDTIKNSIMKLHIPIILIVTLFSSTISYSQNINDNPALKTEYIAMQVTLKYLNIWDNSGLKETVEWNPKETSYHIEAIKKLEELALKGWQIETYYKSPTATFEKFILKRT